MNHVVGRRDGCNLGEGFHLAGPLFCHLENGMGVPHFLGLSSPHILWFHKKHLFSCFFKIHSGRELWWMLLAAPQITLFPPFSCDQVFPETWLTVSQVTEPKGHPAEKFQPLLPRSSAVYLPGKLNSPGTRWPSLVSHQHDLRHKPPCFSILSLSYLLKQLHKYDTDIKSGIFCPQCLLINDFLPL